MRQFLKRSMATSLPSAFRSVEVILDGQAFLTFQTITGASVSSSKLMVMSRRCTVFILMVLNQV